MLGKSQINKNRVGQFAPKKKIKNIQHHAIRTWSPTVLLNGRYTAYIWSIGREA